VISGGKVSEPTAPTRTGYVLVGWFKEAAFTNEWDFETDIVTESITLYAKWEWDMVSLTGGTISGNAVYNASNGDTLFPAGRTVTLSAFSIAKYETTYELWYEVKTWAAGGYTFANAGREGHNGTDGAPPTPAAKTEPVTYISWRDAVVWCNAYSEMSGKDPVYYSSGAVIKDSTNTTAWDNAVMDTTANGYRLPTEAEWEYAARGGGMPSTIGSFAYTYAGTNDENSLVNYAWYKVNSYDAGSSDPNYGTHPVGGKTANGPQLYDMSGNVWEWCWDWYGSIGMETVTNPTGTGSGSARVIRGGSWNVDASLCAAAFRNYGGPNARLSHLGFRVASRP
jgi:uncharacterized repeat protein (TIGR02543 family)